MNRRTTGLAGLIAGTIVIAALALPLAAEEMNRPLVPLPSVLDFSRGDGWGVALGGTVEYGNAYDGADEYEFEVEPAGAIHYRAGSHLFFWEGIELGWRGLLADNWLLQTGARYEGGREADDSEDGYLDGLEDRDDEIVGFAEFRYGLGDNWRAWLGGRVMMGGSDFGTLAVAASGYRFGSSTDGTGSELYVYATFGTDDFINKDFGITASEALASGLPRTELGGGYRSVGLNLIDRRYLSKSIQIIAQAGVELYSDDIQDSPIAREDFEIEVGLSVVYHF